MENSPAVLFDVLIVPDGIEAIQTIAGNGHGVEFIKDMFSHGKTILALGAGRELLEMAGIGSVACHHRPSACWRLAKGFVMVRIARTLTNGTTLTMRLIYSKHDRVE